MIRLRNHAKQNHQLIACITCVRNLLLKKVCDLLASVNIFYKHDRIQIDFFTEPIQVHTTRPGNTRLIIFIRASLFSEYITEQKYWTVER